MLLIPLAFPFDNTIPFHIILLPHMLWTGSALGVASGGMVLTLASIQ